VRREQVCEWSGARMEAFGTLRTTPRHVAKDTGEVVGKSSSARPAAFDRITNWANHWGRTSPGLENVLRYAMGNCIGKQGGIAA
jgi:hypothetical protein